MSDDPRDTDDNADGLAAVPGLARIAVTAGWHTAGWTIQTSMRLSRRFVEAALSPRAAATLAEDARRAARDAVRNLIDVADLEERFGGAGAAADVARRVADVVPGTARLVTTEPDRQNGRASGTVSLREEGEALLRRSRDVHYEESAHPAYERILTELAPDEGRILRLLLFEGPQPTVDVRTGGPVGLLRSRLIAPGLSMIGARAGCRYVDRVPAYLNNLYRLGMVWFSRETLSDPLRYQVLEAQPDVLAAIHSVRQAKVVRRSIHLTPFGEDFCRVCLSEEGDVDRLPAHSAPPGTDRSPQPPTAVAD